MYCGSSNIRTSVAMVDLRRHPDRRWAALWGRNSRGAASPYSMVRSSGPPALSVDGSWNRPNQRRANVRGGSILAIATVAVAVAGCGGSSSKSASSSSTTSSSAPAPSTSTGAAASAPSGASGSQVHLSAVPGKLAFNVKRLTAKAGTVNLSMANPASFAHGVAIEGNGVDKNGKIVGQGGTSTVTVKLKPGTYTFYCPVPGHRQGGMQGTLTVS